MDYFKDRNLSLYQNVTHTEYSTIATGTGVGECSYICKKGKDEAWGEFHIYNSNWSRKKTEAVFNFLHGYKDLIEEKFGAELRWNQMQGTKRCRIYFSRPVVGRLEVMIKGHGVCLSPSHCADCHELVLPRDFFILVSGHEHKNKPCP